MFVQVFFQRYGKGTRNGVILKLTKPAHRVEMISPNTIATFDMEKTLGSTKTKNGEETSLF